MPLRRSFAELPLSLLTLSLLTLVGCATPGVSDADQAIGDDQGQQIADDEVGVQAEALAEDLESVAWHGRQAYLEAQVPAGGDPGGAHQWDVERQLLVSARAGDGFELTVRIRVQVVPGNTSDWDPPGEATVARCFAFVVHDDRDVTPTEVECPDVQPLVVDADVVVPPPPSVGDRDRSAIRRFLRTGGVAADVAELQAMLGRGLTAQAIDVDGVTGVAVTARPDGDGCAVGRRDRARRVEVWHPPRMVTMPGEYGCVPMVAIDPPPPPH